MNFPLTSMMCVFVAMCGAMLAVYTLRRHSFRTAERARTLSAIVELRNLLEVFAQHRGLANALLNGDKTFSDKLRDTQIRIEAISGRLNQLLATTTEWQLIFRQWQSLASAVGSLGVEESFRRHCVLIDQVIRLMTSLCDARDLWSGLSAAQRIVLQVAVTQIPLLIDTLGQARGLGSGAIVQHRVSAPVFVKLKFLSQQAQAMAAGADNQLNVLSKVLNDELATQRMKAQRSTSHFLATIEQELLNKRAPDLASQLYFDAGSIAIADNLVLLNQLLEMAGQSLNRPSNSNHQQRRHNLRARD